MIKQSGITFKYETPERDNALQNKCIKSFLRFQMMPN